MDELEAKPDKSAKPANAEKILATARKRFQAASEYWSDIYDRCKEDIRFANADSDNGYQWNAKILAERNNPTKGGVRPALTINRIPTHVAQVTNEQRRNKPQIKVRPADDSGDPEVADVINGIIRNIHHNTNDEHEGGDAAFSLASEMQVEGGIGYVAVTTDYVADGDDAAQEIYFRAIPDFSAILDDPQIKTATGRDRRYLFETVMLDEDEFEAAYPDADPIDWSVTGPDEAQWLDKGGKRIRLAKYWVCDHVKRPGKRVQYKVRCYTINGQEILETNEWAGRYIPFARIVGKMRIIDGKAEIKGLVRNAKDAQRLFNYGRSAQAEHIALAPKAPFVAPAEAIAGYEDMWEQANNAPHAVLYYNHINGDTGQPIPPPVRAQPAAPNSAISEMVGLAAEDIKATTGQYDAALGARSNETSGVAIRQRQAEGDMATFHFVDNLAQGMKFCGDILVDLIPHIYDTPRTLRSVGEDSTVEYVEVDPDMQMPAGERMTGSGKRKVYNLGKGRYDVVVTVGPGYSTRRQEALQFLTDIGPQVPQLMAATADLLPQLADVPMAEEMAKRARMMLPPEVRAVIDQEKQGEELPPEAIEIMTQAKQQMGQLAGQLESAQMALQQAQAESASLKEGHDIKMEEIASRERIAQMEAQARMEVERIRGEMKAELEMLGARLTSMQQPATQVMLGAQGEAVNVSAASAALQQMQPAVAEIAQALTEIRATQDMLAQAVAVAAQPKSRRVAMVAPSGTRYEAVIDDGAVTMQSPNGVYTGQITETVQ